MNIFKYLTNTYIFCYHRVIPEEVVLSESVHRALYVSPETFERHIGWMKKTGEIIDYRQIFTKSKGQRFVITFDDGWKDNFTYALPILLKYRAPAIIFISTDNVEKGRLFWPEEIMVTIKRSSLPKSEISDSLGSLTKAAMQGSEHRDRANIDAGWSPANPKFLVDRFIEFLKLLSVERRDDLIGRLYAELGVSADVSSSDMLLSWDEVRQMQRLGIAFGSHTHTHAILDRISDEDIENEISSSKLLLESRLGCVIDSFSYPNGCFGNKRIQSDLGRLGFEYAFTLERSPVMPGTDPLLIPRCLVYEDIASDLAAYRRRMVFRSLFSSGLNQIRIILHGRRRSASGQNQFPTLPSKLRGTSSEKQLIRNCVQDEIFKA